MDLADLQQRILIVEDELIVAEDLRAKLESLGYEVGGMAMSGEEALEMAEECRGALDLALMDIRLAGKMDGVETAGVMRERFDIPVIYLTAHSDTHTLERAKLTEPFGFLNKPLNARNLHSTVEMALYKHKIDRQLRISEERFRIMFETAQDGIFMKDEALRYTQVNPAIEELLNLPVEKIIGVTDRELLGPPAAAASEASEQRVLQGEVVEEDVTWGVDGTDRVLHVVRVPMRAGRDRVMGLCCIARDITERKLEEEERRRLARRLEKAQKQESLRMMAGGVAHDFNNLLQAIIGNADYVLEETPRTSHCYVDVENIKTTAVRAAELTKQMLDFSGTSPVAAEPLDASALVNEVSALLESAVGLHVDLRYSLAEGLPAVRGDINQLRQILLNLVINASEAFGDGSGEVAVQTGLTDADEADLQDLLLGDERSAGTYVFVEVADNGPGMDADTQGRAFDPFFSTKFTGRGLGLATVLGIVRGHGGAVDLKSEVGAGTVFRILLPATDDVLPRRQCAGMIQSEDDQGTNGAGRVLLVDDESGVRYIVTRGLERSSFVVVAAADGTEAMRAFAKTPDAFDAAVLDLKMPGLAGLQTYRSIRALREDIPVVFSSGYREASVRRQVDISGPVEFIQKPYMNSTLVECIRRLLARPGSSESEPAVDA